MEPPRPEIRAAVTKSVLGEIERLPEDVRETVWDLLDPEVIDRARAAGRLSWFSLADNLGLYEAVHRAGGREALLEVARGVAVRGSRIPLFRPILEGALRLSGTTIHGLLRSLPRAHYFSTRNAGELEVAPLGEGGGALVRIYALPPVLRSPIHGMTWVGCVEGMASMIDPEARISGPGHDVGAGEIVVRVSPR